MNPILYPANESNFISNGFGRLSDAISCSVKEVLNGVYELTLVYPVEGVHFSDLQENRIIYAIHDETGEPQPFEIYRIGRPINRKVTVNAAHISYRLNKSIVKPFIANGVQTALMDLVSYSVTQHGFTFVTDKTTVANMKVSAPVAIRAIMGGVEGSVIDVYGGEWEFDHFQCNLKNRRGQDSGVNIRYGKNLTDVTKITDTTNLWTGIVPYWTGADDTNEQISVVYNGVIYSSYRSSYPYDAIVAVDASSAFEAQPTQAQLQSWGQTYVNNNAKTEIPLSVSVSFVQLWQTEEYKDVAPLQRLRLGDTVNVFYEALGVNNTARITECVYNVLLERYDSMTIGDVRTNLATAVSQDVKNATKDLPSKTFIEIAIDKATELITGGLGGHVVINTNEAGQPNEILIMNTDNKETATRVMRINYQGIAFGTGYNGPFNSAWTTLDGTFNAQNINVINLTAAAITTGILKDQQNKNYWNMDTGEFSLASTVTVGGSTVQSIANSAVNAQTQQSIFNKLTNNGQVQGITLSNGQLYINASYINSGVINANLITSGKIQSSNGQVYFDLTNNELACSYMRPVQRSGETWYNYLNNYIMQWLYVSYANQNIGCQSGTKYGALDIVYNEKSSSNKYGVRFSIPDNDDIIAITSFAGTTEKADLRIGNSYEPLNTASGMSYGVGILEFKPDDQVLLRYKVSQTTLRQLILGETSIDLYFRASGNKKNEMVIDNYGFDITGDVSITGGVDVSGTKNRVVSTPSYGDVLMDAYETTSPMFADIGEAKTDASGICFVAIDDVFREVSRTDIEYQVFLQKEGQGDLWIDEKHPAWFTVKGSPNLKFAWEIKAKQRGFELNRTERKDTRRLDADFASESDDYDYYNQFYEDYTKEQEDIFYDQTA